METPNAEAVPMLLRPLGEGCECVTTHSPKAYVPALHHIIPESWGGPSTKANLIMLCPNTHTAVHRLIDEYVRAEGVPPWTVRRQFSFFQQRLAERAWEGRPANPRITSTFFHE